MRGLVDGRGVGAATHRPEAFDGGGAQRARQRGTGSHEQRGRRREYSRWRGLAHRRRANGHAAEGHGVFGLGGGGGSGGARRLPRRR